MRRLARRLIKSVPLEAKSLTLIVGSVPASYDEQGTNTWTTGISYKAEVPHIICPDRQSEGQVHEFFATYNRALEAAVQACSYFNSIGVPTKVFDTRRHDAKIDAQIRSDDNLKRNAASVIPDRNPAARNFAHYGC